MKILLVPALLLAFSFPVAAASNQPGGGGLGFNCDVNQNKCSCVGAETGADCKAMLKNCAGKIIWPENCTIDPQTKKSIGCECNMAASARNAIKKGRIDAPVGTKNQQ